MTNDKKIIAEKYNDLINNVKIHNINLKKLNVECNDNCIMNSDISVKISFDPDKYEVESGFLKVYPSFIVEAIDINEATLFSVNFTYYMEYSFESNGVEIENEYIEAFVKRNVPINIWPYARELVSSLTTRMGFPALIIEPFTVK